MAALTPPRLMKPKDGCVWITGGSSGIGAALALDMAKRGWTVAISSRSQEALEAVAKAGEGRIHAFPLDISDPEACEHVVSAIEDQLGPIAMAVLNAGIYLNIDAAEPDYNAYAKTFDVNLKGTAACLCALIPVLKARKAGQIAIVSSATSFGGMPTASAYGASKAALVNMAECLRIELYRHGLHVQVITPGFVETPAQDDNAFPKPFMISPQKAARRIRLGLKRRRFEITFPRRFTWILKAMYALPYGWSLPLVRKQTGWDKPE